MNYKYLFTSFDGRIGRREYWLGILILVIASFVLIGVLGTTLGLFLPVSLVSFIGSAIIFYPAIALSMKRLHDRNKAAKPWAYIFFGPGILMQLMRMSRIGFVNVAVDNVIVAVPSNGLIGLLSIVAGLISLWAIIDMGFIKGSEGENRFGPDPLKAKTS